MTCTFHFIARKNTSGQRFFRRINSTPTSSWLVTRSTCCKILTTELSTAKKVDRNATVQTAGQQVATQLESACASCKRILVTHTMMHIPPRGQEPRFCSQPICRLKRNVCRWRENESSLNQTLLEGKSTCRCTSSLPGAGTPALLCWAASADVD